MNQSPAKNGGIRHGLHSVAGKGQTRKRDTASNYVPDTDDIRQLEKERETGDERKRERGRERETARDSERQRENARECGESRRELRRERERERKRQRETEKGTLRVRVCVYRTHVGP